VKDKYVKVRLTEVEKELLGKRAVALKMTMSDYIRYCCLSNPPNPYGFEREEEYLSKKLTESEIEKISANARASVEMEGLKPSKESDEITKRFLRGEISDQEAKTQILKLHDIEI
jgi:hypothetical protein